MTDAAWKAVGNAIAALPLSDRLAYARGLVEGDGFVVARVPDECDAPPDDAPICADPAERSAWRDGYEAGWNALRAMLAARPKVTPETAPETPGQIAR